ncbi:oleate-activated transcription factor PIP2 KNAG_0E00210 [Huiozyma naganishii CBS 8797]|uniref:Zn(2)-C6 fungal-type domain-containing protein n=1 Tax=Huiozyma naganishii (strain ATCC MYA-139 / BCRC 22969 / CBS 8797 / KCTC 17520 / NBRC 10181 / NCYC 3082 / Yp74L-3) TaxID=1071383 RepID=J7S6A9_HUIN7|nr:hypothetical protein KNAG_0E00210 [Kazachstania naganishii CBS 8797]CCK70289.1 hypothetical protein KNAG_0E00210 [Kazachstania naganishii CBS 8797]
MTDRAVTGPDVVVKAPSQKRKRNRLSYVCKACRTAKAKCDKEKPQCGRCYKLGVECVYDTIIQTGPKYSTKETKIRILENELDYWQKKTKELFKEQEDSILKRSKNVQKGPQESVAGSNRLAWLEPVLMAAPTDRSSLAADPFFQLHVNVCNTNPRLIMSRVMKREVNPLSENYLIINDTFFAALLVSLFMNLSSKRECNSGNIIISALTADLSISRTHSDVTQSVTRLKNVTLQQSDPKDTAKINEFFDRLFQITDPNSNVKMKTLMESLKSTTENAYLEDHCTNDYSDLLKSFIKSFETLLPPMNIIEDYKNHFYESIYAMLPFLEIDMFEEVISGIIRRDPKDSSKISISLGQTELRNKIENLCLLACILKVSYMSLSMTEMSSFPDGPPPFDPQILQEHPISSDLITLVLRCISSENWGACPNENIISNLLYVWAFFVFSPDEGDFFVDAPTDILGDTVIMLSTAVGLHRDPSDYTSLRQYLDKRLLNHRRLLWLSVISMSVFESVLKGRRIYSNRLLDTFIDINSGDAFADYMDRVERDLPENCKTRMFLLNLHEMVYRRTYLALLHQDLNDLTMTYSSSIPLWKIENAMSKIDDFNRENMASKAVSLSELGESPEDMLNQMFIITTRPTLLFIGKIISDVLELRTTYALMLHFEQKCHRDGTSHLKYYFRYFKLTVKNAIKLAHMYEQYYHPEDPKDALSPMTRYYLSKFFQMSISSAMFTLLVLSMRTELTEHLFQRDPSMADEVCDIIETITQLKKVNHVLQVVLTRIYHLGTENLRYSYFSIFKMFAMYDLILQRINSGQLWSGLFREINGTEIDPRISKFLSMSFNVEWNLGSAHGVKLIDALKSRNHCIGIPVGDLIDFIQELESMPEYMEMARHVELSVDGLFPMDPSNSLSPQDVSGTLGGTPPTGGEANLSRNLTSTFGNLDIFNYDFFFHNDE